MKSHPAGGRLDPRIQGRLLSLAWVAVVFSPILLLLVESLRAVAIDPSLLALALPVDRRLGLFLNSVSLSAAVSLSAVTVGALAGSYLWGWNTGASSKLRWLVLALIPVPPYIHALSWMTTLAWLSNALKGVGVTIPTMGWAPTYFVEFMTYLPLGVGLSLIGYTGVEAEMVEAARLHRGDGEVFTRVVLPLVAPALVAAGGLIFAFTVTDFSVPALFAVNVYSLEVFSDFSATNQASRAMTLSLPILVSTLLVLWGSQSSLRSTFQSGALARSSPKLKYPLWIKAPQAAAAAVAGAQILVLAASLLTASGGLNNIIYAASMAASDMEFSLLQSMTTAILCAPLALVAAQRLNDGSRLWWLLAVAPLGVPSPLIGISVIRLTSFTGLLYGSWAAPVIGTVVKFTPVASMVTLAYLKRCDPLLFEAADIYRRGAAEAWVKVKLPLMASGVAAAGAIVFAFTMGELGSTLLTVPPGFSTVTIRVFNYLHYGGSDVVAGLCLMMVTVMILAGLAGVASISARRYMEEEAT